MYLSTKTNLRGVSFQGILQILVTMVLLLPPLLAAADEDPCREEGIYVRNLTGINIWYTRDGGPCTIWSDDHILKIKPEETLLIYRDMICQTEYCPKNPTYDDYKSLDADLNCRVRILPSCNLSDM